MTREYQLIRSRRKSLELRVYPDQRIEVRAPLRCAQRDIDSFIAQRETWLQKRLAQFAAQPAAEPLGEGARVYLLGEALQLTVRRGRGAGQRCGGRLELACASPKDPDSVRRALHRWLRGEAEALFQARLETLFEPFRRRGHSGVPALRIRSMRSRWGSLSRHGGMTLNLALMHSPLSCLDYVITHELCHLEHMNHGPRFKALMSQMMPDWQERRRRLNDTAWTN